jgi:hypothetical protein
MGLGKFFKKVLNAPAKLAGKTFYKVSKAITGSEKLSIAGARMFAVSTSALSGDPLPFRETFTGEDIGVSATKFRKGKQAGDAVGLSIGSLFVGGALIGGSAAAGGAAGGGSTATGAGVETFAAYDSALAAGAAEGVGSTAGVFGGESSLLAYDAALAAGAAEGVGTVGATTVATGASTGIFSSGNILSGLGLGGLLKAVLGTAAEVGVEGGKTYLEREIQSMFGGGGGGSSGVPGGMGGSGSESDGLFSMSKLPLILLVITLVGAFLLSRKGRKL